MYFKAVVVIFVFNILQKYPTSSMSQNWVELTKQLKNNIRKWYKENFPSVNDSISAGRRPSSILNYPGNDKKRLNIINVTWNNYYFCLQAKEEAVLEDKTLPPYTIAAFIDSSIQYVNFKSKSKIY